MTGEEIHAVLTQRGITHLHHANSVMTSNSQILLRALASRGAVLANQLPQTGQYTDAIDQQYGIWNDVFVDVVDIHARISKRNQYGPVMFEVGIDILRALPQNTGVFMTRLNPTKWENLPDAGRYFLTIDELRNGFVKGNFDQMLVIKSPTGMVPFGNYLNRIVLDDPLQPNNSQQYGNAFAQLNNSLAAVQPILVFSVTRRQCHADCKCTASYAADWQRCHMLF